MRHFIGIDADHFVVYEAITEPAVACPTCRKTELRTVERSVTLYQGDRDNEAGWVLKAREPVDLFPVYDQSESAARRFAEPLLA